MANETEADHVNRTAQIVAASLALGFSRCGIAPAADFPELGQMEEWLSRGYAGEMRYLHDIRRRSPSLVVANAQSVIVCAMNYNTALPYSTEVPEEIASSTGPHGWISRYAWGEDYHRVLGDKLDAVVDFMRKQFPDENWVARAYVDTGPIVERVAAKYAGLGWLAKNTCLINEEDGSWLLLGVIVTTLDLAPSITAAETPPADLCGNCSLCIDACPTEALVEPYVLDARLCISYLTIELRGSVPEALRPRMGRHVFGCDICQDVCPYNRNAPINTLESFQPRQLTGKSLFSPSLEWLLCMSEDEFREAFRRSPVKRTKWRGLIRNACIAVGNSSLRNGEPRYDEVCKRLEQLAASHDTLVAEHAAWALKRLQPAT